MRTPCPAHKGCFANNGGYCGCLGDNDFKGKMCPFYKHKDDAAADSERSLQRLLANERTDLIETYHRRKIVYA